MIKVLLIDDHQSILDSFNSVISCEKDIKLVGTLTDASKALDACKDLEPHVVLTDVCTENGNSGIVATSDIKKQYPHIKVIVMSGFDEISYIPSAKESGASAFLSKARPIHDFIQMIRAVNKGQESFPQPMQIPTASGQMPFTQREIEVLHLLCRSYKREEIADALCISLGTLKRHIENMLEKSGCTSAMELAVYVTGNGWINTIQK